MCRRTVLGFSAIDRIKNKDIKERRGTKRSSTEKFEHKERMEEGRIRKRMHRTRANKVRGWEEP